MDSSELYEKDFLLWSNDQVTKFKAGKTDELDLENIMQEIEDMGREQKVALQSLFRNLLVHLLKLNYSPAESPRLKWIGEVSEFRAQIETRLEQTPSLSHHSEELFARAWLQARKIADQNFTLYGENVSRPTSNPYDLKTALDSDVFPGYEPNQKPHP